MCSKSCRTPLEHPADVSLGWGFVFSGMTGGFLVSPFLAGIVYAKAGYFPVFILVFAALAFDLFLRNNHH